MLDSPKMTHGVKFDEPGMIEKPFLSVAVPVFNEVENVAELDSN